MGEDSWVESVALDVAERSPFNHSSGIVLGWVDCAGLLANRGRSLSPG
ncbi:MAG: hypothetical protein WBA43_15815 [Elainellaceae cyanobacterium]